MNHQTKIDLQKVEVENKDVICIQLYCEAESPHGDGYIHGGNPCTIESLVKLGWIRK